MATLHNYKVYLYHLYIPPRTLKIKQNIMYLLHISTYNLYTMQSMMMMKMMMNYENFLPKVHKMTINYNYMVCKHTEAFFF